MPYKSCFLAQQLVFWTQEHVVRYLHRIRSAFVPHSFRIHPCIAFVPHYTYSNTCLQETQDELAKLTNCLKVYTSLSGTRSHGSGERGIILRYSGTVMVDVDVYSTVIQYKQGTSRRAWEVRGAWGRGTWGRGTNRNETRYSLLL